jgi:hypothetical protein
MIIMGERAGIEPTTTHARRLCYLATVPITSARDANRDYRCRIAAVERMGFEPMTQNPDIAVRCSSAELTPRTRPETCPGRKAINVAASMAARGTGASSATRATNSD